LQKFTFLKNAFFQNQFIFISNKFEIFDYKGMLMHLYEFIIIQ